MTLKIPNLLIAEVGARPGFEKESLEKVGEVVVVHPKPFYEKLPLVRQFLEVRKSKIIEKEENHQVFALLKDCIATGVLKNQDEIDNFSKAIAGSDAGLVENDVYAAGITELAVIGANIPLGVYILAMTGGDINTAFWAGVVVQGIIRGSWVGYRGYQEMKEIVKKEDKKSSKALKFSGFGLMYSAIFFGTDFVPILGTFPLTILSAPRNTRYAVKKIEVGIRRLVTSVMEIMDNASNAVDDRKSLMTMFLGQPQR